jgi:S1-C subfamily serine protease
MLLFAAAAGASAGVVALTTRGSSPSTTTSSTSPLGSGSSAPLPTASSSPTGAPLTQAQIEAKVDPAIVDVTVTLAGGTAQGTGMVITSTGEILTNNHVIDGATAIKVTIGGTGTTYAANVVGYDVADDIALLQISSSVSGLSTISVGNPAQLAVGDTVLALGNALGRGGTPTPAAGTITGLGRTITAGDSSGNSETLTNLIEVNARIQPGDSGGPLVNQYGQVIGMDTAASVSGGRFRNITGTGQGYAIPIDTALTIVQQIRNGGGGNPNIQVGPRALLGVQINGTSGGATVVGTQAGGPAAGLGIVAGDVITSVGGVQVDSSQSLQAAILKHKPGDKVTVTWTDQAGTQHSGTATLVPGPPA